jgi:hypothetical protein
MLFHEYQVLKIEGKSSKAPIKIRHIDGPVDDIVEEMLENTITDGDPTIREPLNEDNINFIDEHYEVEKGFSSFLNNTGQEAEKIYKYIVQEIGVTDTSTKSRRERKEAVLKNYNKIFPGHRFIKESHLQDLEIYTFRRN